MLQRLFSGWERLDVVVSEEDAVTPNALVQKACARNNIPLVSELWLHEVLLEGVPWNENLHLWKAQRTKRGE